MGSTTDAFTQCPEVYADDRCFSIIHGDEFSTLDLVFPTQEESIHWTVGLRYLLAKNSGIKMIDLCHEDWLDNNSVVATQFNFNFTTYYFISCKIVLIGIAAQRGLEFTIEVI